MRPIKYIHIIALLLLYCLTTYAVADTIQLQQNAPERYVVVKGDTLWDISARFLKNPWQWPKIWNMNRAQIKNPHWIYPGDVVLLEMVNGQPQLRLLHETVVLQPDIREEPLDKEAIPAIASNIVGPFLSQPLIIEPNSLAHAPTIIGAPENRVVLSPGVKVYIDGIDDDASLLWHIYRPGKVMIDPDTKEQLGVEAFYLGDARITKQGSPATAEITKAKEEIFIQDKLVAAPGTWQTPYLPHAPENDINGRIISIYGGVAEAGRNAIVTINRGSAQGLEEGHVLAIYRNGKLVNNPTTVKGQRASAQRELNYANNDLHNSAANIAAATNNPDLIKLPDERIGLLMVFRVFDRVAYALIMQSSEPVNLLDSVHTP